MSRRARARIPRLRRRPKVALLIETSNRYSRDLLQGIHDWTRRNTDWAIHLTEQGRGSLPPRWLGHWQGDGIIARIENEAIAAAVRGRRVPVINVSASGLTPEFPTVISDSAAVARLAAEHLLERGLRQFAYCGDSRFAWSARHGENFVVAVRSRGAACQVFEETGPDPEDWEAGSRQLAAWLASLPRPVGIMACYDIRGQQVLDVCRALKLRVPDEIAVIGQHNDDLLCNLCDPPLSSVIPDARRAGYEAAELLDRQLHGARVHALTRLIPPVGVATRQSTDVIACDHPGVAAAARFIREHACDGINVADVLRAVPMARTVLERGFRTLLGRTPHEHIVQARMERARQLLASTDFTVARTAERTGFRNAEYFSAAFKQHEGLSPRAYRRRHRPA